MKAKSGKIIKICALSLGLLMLGGATITPITKVYAEGSGQQDQQEMDRIIRIKYQGDENSKRFNGVWLWVDKSGQEGHFVPFKEDKDGNRYLETTLRFNGSKKIGYIVYQSEQNPSGEWSKPNDTNKDIDHDRFVTVNQKGVELTLRAGVDEEPEPTVVQYTIADKVGDKLKPYIKDLKVWYGDRIDWEKALDKTSAANDDNVKDALEKISVEDASSRNNTITTKQDGDIKVTFKDGSSLKFKNNLYVTHEVTAASNQNAPEDAIEIELKLGDGVEDKAANKTGPTLYNKYKAKPGIDVSKAQIGGAGTLFDLNVKPIDPKQKVKWVNKAGNAEYKVTDDNKVFTATAIDQTIIRINYHRPDKNINGWKVMIYYGGKQVYSQDFTESDKNGNYYAEVSLDGKLDSVSYKIINETTGEVEKNGTNDKDGKRTLKIDKNNDKTEATVKAKKPEVEPGKKPLVPSVKPDHSKSLDYKIVPEKKTEKKVKPSEKVRKSYKNLRISREKNVVAVKAAKLLLEIAPERVKDVKTNLINLIAKSESLVKNADTILEKLEAKYEF